MDNIQVSCLTASSECCWKEKIVADATINGGFGISGLIGGALEGYSAYDEGRNFFTGDYTKVNGGQAGCKLQNFKNPLWASRKPRIFEFGVGSNDIRMTIIGWRYKQSWGAFMVLLMVNLEL